MPPRGLRDEFLQARRLIACLDLKQDQVVKGVRFQQLEVSGDP